MRDWHTFVRDQLELDGLKDLREERIIDELALQLYDLCQEAIDRGMSAEEADQWTLSQVPDWTEFSHTLSDVERPNRRPAADRWIESSEERLRTHGWGARILADLLQDIQFTWRSACFNPTFWVITVLILGLGIGATTTIFSVVKGVLLEKLPYPEPERIAFFERPAFSPPRFLDWKEHADSFEHLAGVFSVDLDYTGGDQPWELHGGLMTPDFFELFGARAELGRLFSADDYAGPPTRAVLGYTAWQRLFGGDQDVIGRTMTINGLTREIVGVLDRSFRSPRGFSDEETDIWLALDPRWGAFFDPGALILTVYGRIAPGFSLEGAEEELNGKIVALAADNPALHSDPEDGPRFVHLAGLQNAITGDTRSNLLMLLGAVTLLLLISTANVANILLARGFDRIDEVGVRSAMGAGQGRIMAQMLTESAIMSLSGGVLGIALAAVGIRAFEVLNPGNIPLIDRISLDWRVLLFAGGISILTGLIFGAVPARRAARLDISGMMHRGPGGGVTRDRGRLRNTLAAIEIALALILLTGAGLLFNSFIRLQSVDPGFDPGGLVGVELSMSGPRYTDDFMIDLVRRVDGRLEGLPGIEGVATAITVPFQFWGSRRTGWLRWEWETPDREEREIWAMVHPATADYFALLDAQVRGRMFEPGDMTGTQVPVVVSETFAEEICPDEDALGKTFYGHGWDEGITELKIVGIVSGLHAWGLDQGSELTVFPPWEMYGPGNSMASLLISTSGVSASAIESIREAIWAEDPDMPLPNIFLLEDRIDASAAVPRFYAALLMTFSIVALLLAAAGVYGAMIVTVGRKRRELSIRTALGADRRTLIRLVLYRSGRITIAGVVTGAIGAWLTTRFIESLLFGVTSTDPFTFLIVAFIMTVVALGASLLPAWKAAMSDPMEALRQE
ncbi:ABC transporter permease [Candidatus Zixiibacteriota bacterium]